MKAIQFIIIFICFSTTGFSQSKPAFKDKIKAYQADQNEKFKDQRISPLKDTDRSHFERLKFCRPKAAYRVQAKFVRTTDAKPFEMPTTTDRNPVYEKYGEVHFEIKGRKLHLAVYQSHDSRRNPLYRKNLFLPFKDMTNSKTTYGGGRFIDIKIPTEDTMIIDFNKAYNPYCAYSPKYSCPIVPKENHLKLAIKAGVKKFTK